MNTLRRTQEIPRIPKDLVKPTIVAGINAIGRGQDSDALTQFMTTIAQTIGPEAIMQYINSDELIKRYAAAQGIDYLNLVKTQEQLSQESEQQQMNAMDMELAKQASSFASVDQQAAAAQTPQ